MNRKQARKRRQAFTLMEVLLVMAILIILASLVTVGYQQIRRNANEDAARTQIHTLVTACDLYFGDVGQFPQDLAELVQQPQGPAADKWRGPYMKDSQIPKDPWQRDYVVSNTTDEYNNPKLIISSSGPNGTPGDDDDISSS